MKHLLALLAVYLLALSPARALDIDSWKNYFAYRDATEVVEADGVLYAILNGNLMAYDTKTTEVRYIDRITAGLSSKGITFLGYSPTENALVIVYPDGNIDIYDIDSGYVSNIPQFRDNPDNDFALNNLKVQDSEALLATNEGVIAIDVKHKVIKGRYAIGKTSAAIKFDGRLYASLLTTDGKQGSIISIALDDNLLDRTHWETLAEKPISDMAVMGDCLYMFCIYNEFTNKGDLPDAGIWIKCGRVQDGALTKISPYCPLKASSAFGRTVAYGANPTYKDKAVIEFSADHPDRPTVARTDTPFNSIYPSKEGGYWVALASSGLTHYAFADNTFVADGNSVNGGGPLYDMPYYLNFEGDRLFMTPGRNDPGDDDSRAYHVSWLNSETEEWTEFETPYGEYGGVGPYLRKNHDWQDATSVAQDPFDPDHHFVTSYRQGLFEYRGGKLVKQYTEGNSAIRSCSGSLSYDYVRTSAAVFDKDGNLFLANNGGGNPVNDNILCLTRDGKWISYYFTPIANATNFAQAIFDRKGRLWMPQRRTAGPITGGFLCMDFNGTLENTKDDLYTYRTIFKNQDGTVFNYQQAICLAEDHTGRIWLGTEAGLLVVDDPDTWSNDDFTITQVKVPRPDGIYADYLLAGTVITAIAVDGANRKWIGTGEDGVYLVSDDGVTTLHHFTTKNSPLVSDHILSIACHPTTGEVFIGTQQGLMSYQSDASESSETLTRDNLRVYPNPVRPDYSGPIVLDGLVYDSDIKVVSTAGHVVAAGTSVGGTFTWNGRGPSGERVGSGIYYFMVASPDGKESTVAKVAVVR